jgi:ribosomal protein S10
VDDVRDLREVVDEVAIGAERTGLMTSSPLLDPSEDDVDDLLEEDEEVLTGAERTGLTTSSPLSDPSVDDVLDLREVVDELVVGAERTGLTTSSPLSDPSADDVFDFVEVFPLNFFYFLKISTKLTMLSLLFSFLLKETSHQILLSPYYASSWLFVFLKLYPLLEQHQHPIP